MTGGPNVPQSFRRMSAVIDSQAGPYLWGCRVGQHPSQICGAPTRSPLPLHCPPNLPILNIYRCSALHCSSHVASPSLNSGGSALAWLGRKGLLDPQSWPCTLLACFTLASLGLPSIPKNCTVAPSGRPKQYPAEKHEADTSSGQALKM